MLWGLLGLLGSSRVLEISNDQHQPLLLNVSSSSLLTSLESFFYTPLKISTEMEYGKGDLPPYSAVAVPTPDWRRRWSVRRSRGVRVLALACLAFIVYAQWRQIQPRPKGGSIPQLSVEKLNEDLRTCSKLRSQPQDPIGLGRERNARYIDGYKPTLIKNATIWIGEPIEGTSDEEARGGKGFSWINADVLLEYGLIKEVRKGIDTSSLSSDTLVWDAKGRKTYYRHHRHAQPCWRRQSAGVSRER